MTFGNITWKFLGKQNFDISAEHVHYLPNVSFASVASKELYKPCTRLAVVLYYCANTAAPLFCMRSVIQIQTVAAAGL